MSFYVDQEAQEVHISADTWVTIILPDSTEITVKGVMVVKAAK